jgi:enamine deaminase RidA (YjgF/YER057c/UK114 family)
VTRKTISTGSPFEAAAGYSRAVIDGGMIYVSGTTGYDYKTMVMPDSVEEQTRNIFATLEKVLAEAGATLNDVVRVNYIVTDISYADALFSVTREKFAASRPAMTIIVAGLLRPEMKVEIEITARKTA